MEIRPNLTYLTSGIGNDQAAYEAYRQQLREDNNRVSQEFLDSQRKELAAFEKNIEAQKEELMNGYRVELSREAMEHQKEMAALRESHKQEIDKEKQEFELTYQKVRDTEAKRAENVRRKQEENIAREHEKYQDTIKKMEAQRYGT